MFRLTGAPKDLHKEEVAVAARWLKKARIDALSLALH